MCSLNNKICFPCRSPGVSGDQKFLLFLSQVNSPSCLFKMCPQWWGEQLYPGRVTFSRVPCVLKGFIPSRVGLSLLGSVCLLGVSVGAVGVSSPPLWVQAQGVLAVSSLP